MLIPSSLTKHTELTGAGNPSAAVPSLLNFCCLLTSLLLGVHMHRMDDGTEVTHVVNIGIAMI